jgi:transglutaminase-like putative cysteine protease
MTPGTFSTTLPRPRPTLPMMLAIAPAVTLVIGFSASVGWLRDPAPLLALIAWSLILACGFAISRFRPSMAFALSLTLSLGLSLLIVGRIAPSPAQALDRPLEETLRFMNVRLWTLTNDLGRGPGLAFAGDFPGTAMATTVYGLLVWQALYALIWSGTRRRSPWPAVFLCLALLVVRDLLSGRPPTWSLGMTAAILIFAVWGSYASRVEVWDRKGLGYSLVLWENWTAAMIGIAVVAFFVTGSTTPQWRDSIQGWLDSLGAPPGRAAPPAAARPRATPLRAVPDLGVIGAPFPHGDAAALFVRTDEGVPGLDPSNRTQRHYWRGAVYERYTGRGWETAPLGDPVDRQDDAPPDAGSRERLAQEFEVVATLDQRLYAANQPLAVDGGPALRSPGADASTSLVVGTEKAYTVVSWVSHATRDELTGAGSDYPVGIREVDLQLPQGLPRRVTELAARLASGAGSAFEIAVRVQDYLRSSYPYRDLVPPPPPGRDAVDYFLFDSTGGFCSYYASAMVVLLRSVGVPSRVATGFAGGSWDPVEGRYRVAESQAHAWVEVYFPGHGWVEFEPTPSRPALDYGANPSPPADATRSGNLANVPLSRPPNPVPAAMAALALSALGIAYWWKNRPHRNPERELHRLYWALRRSVAGDGQIALTPWEFVSRWDRSIESLPRLTRAMRLLTSLYVRTTYSRQGLNPGDIVLARRAWRSAWRDRARHGIARALGIRRLRAVPVPGARVGEPGATV